MLIRKLADYSVLWISSSTCCRGALAQLDPSRVYWRRDNRARMVLRSDREIEGFYAIIVDRHRSIAYCWFPIAISFSQRENPADSLPARS